MLSLWRRHTAKCEHQKEGRSWTKCKCPVWCDGKVNGERVREPMDTRDWARAGRKAADRETELESGRRRKTVETAVAAFLEQCSIESSTFKKYSRWLNALAEHTRAERLTYLDEVDLEFLDAHRTRRGGSALTWSKELQLLRSFFGFCMKRKWCEENPARDMKMPYDPKPKERKPYTTEEITKIIAASDTFGRGPYERLRARAMILIMRFYGLRVSDVATLARERVRNGEVHIQAMKNGVPVWLPLYPAVARALECLPLPKGAAADCPYFFWSGAGSRDRHIVTIDRTLQAVFRESGVEGACSHRFRHTLVTEILEKGGTIEDAANVIGDSPATVRKHYAKWTVAYRNRMVEIMQRVHGTSVAQGENQSVTIPFSEFRMVPEVGLEQNKPTDNKQLTDNSSRQKRLNRQNCN